MFCLTEHRALAKEQSDLGKTHFAEFVLQREQIGLSELIDSAWEMEPPKEPPNTKVLQECIIIQKSLEEQCIEGCYVHGLSARLREVLKNNDVNCFGFAAAI